MNTGMNTSNNQNRTGTRTNDLRKLRGWDLHGFAFLMMCWLGQSLVIDQAFEGFVHRQMGETSTIWSQGVITIYDPGYTLSSAQVPQKLSLEWDLLQPEIGLRKHHAQADSAR